MSDFFHLSQCCKIKTGKIINDMAKIQIKSEETTPFGGIFHVRAPFSPFVDSGYRQSSVFFGNKFAAYERITYLCTYN